MATSLTIYHNPRCTKSRQTLALIEEAGIKPDIVLYLDTPPSEAELDKILRILDLEPQELMRKNESMYSELGLADKKLSRREAIKLMVEHPKLIERPIVVKGNKAILGRPPENVRELL
jgi:arsenate reductase